MLIRRFPQLASQERYPQLLKHAHCSESGGQSPLDLEAGGKEILAALRSRFTQIKTHPGCSFIYRLLGGIRGPEKVIHNLARFLTHYERLSIKKGYLGENAFYFLGRKKKNT